MKIYNKVLLITAALVMGVVNNAKASDKSPLTSEQIMERYKKAAAKEGKGTPLTTEEIIDISMGINEEKRLAQEAAAAENTTTTTTAGPPTNTTTTTNSSQPENENADIAGFAADQKDLAYGLGTKLTGIEIDSFFPAEKDPATGDLKGIIDIPGNKLDEVVNSTTAKPFMFPGGRKGICLTPGASETLGGFFASALFRRDKVIFPSAEEWNNDGSVNCMYAIKEEYIIKDGGFSPIYIYLKTKITEDMFPDDGTPIPFPEVICHPLDFRTLTAGISVNGEFHETKLTPENCSLVESMHNNSSAGLFFAKKHFQDMIERKYIPENEVTIPSMGMEIISPTIKASYEYVSKGAPVPFDVSIDLWKRYFTREETSGEKFLRTGYNPDFRVKLPSDGSHHSSHPVDSFLKGYGTHHHHHGHRPVHHRVRHGRH